MKAIRLHEFGGPDVMKIEDVDDPTPGPGQVVVSIKAAGVNPVDTYVRSGAYALKPPLPYTPGMDGAGDVEAIGDGVTRVAVGDRVYTAGALSGAYAEKTLCAEFQVYKLPDGISYGQGAALGIPYGTAHRALFHRAQGKSGDTVLIHGASGGVGIAAIQLARNAGMTVIATAGAKEGEELVANEGADHVLNHHNPDHLEQALAITNGNGMDIILEMLANVNLGKELSALAPQGRVVVIGSRGAVEIDARDLMFRDADIRGMSLINLTVEDRDAIHADLCAGLEKGALRPIVSRELPLADAPQAHVDVIEKSTHGKIVLVP